MKPQIGGWFFQGVQKGATCKVTNPDGTEAEIICNISCLIEEGDLLLPETEFFARVAKPMWAVIRNYLRDKAGIQ